MRNLVIGDMHGCLRSLENLVEQVGFEADDVVITLGDYVDRGPKSREVVEWLVGFSHRHKLIALRGNHDIMMLESKKSQDLFDWWLACGGNTTLESYELPCEHGQYGMLPPMHLAFLEHFCKPYHETETHIFVHAFAYSDLTLEEQPDSALYWEKLNNPVPHHSGKVLVCGHTAQRSGVPLNLGHTICIDTWVYGDGWLTCLDTESSHYWQANERGETREGDLC